MSNYLKKLAYIKRELVKLAEPVSILERELPPGLQEDLEDAVTTQFRPQMPSVLTPESRATLGSPDLEYMEPYPRPNSVTSMSTMRPPYQWDPNIPVTEEIPATPKATTFRHYSPERLAQIDSQRRNAMARRGMLPGQPARELYEKWRGPMPTQYTQEQLQRVRDYQNALINGMVRRDGLTRGQARQKLKDNGRWYKINKDRTITVNMGPKSQPKRFSDIINGRRTAQDIKWRGGIDPYSDMATPAPGSPNAQAMVSRPATANTVTSQSQRPKPKKQSQPVPAPVSAAPAVQTPTAQANPPAQTSQGFQRVPGRPFLNVRNRFRANRGLPPIR